MTKQEIDEEMRFINRIYDMLHSGDEQMKQLGILACEERYRDTQSKMVLPFTAADCAALIASRSYILGTAMASIIYPQIVENEENSKRQGTGMSLHGYDPQQERRDGKLWMDIG